MKQIPPMARMIPKISRSDTTRPRKTRLHCDDQNGGSCINQRSIGGRGIFQPQINPGTAKSHGQKSQNKNHPPLLAKQGPMIPHSPQRKRQDHHRRKPPPHECQRKRLDRSNSISPNDKIGRKKERTQGSAADRPKLEETRKHPSQSENRGKRWLHQKMVQAFLHEARKKKRRLYSKREPMQ